MQKNSCSLTVFFESPFWVGVCQCLSADGLEVCKVTFGEEPKDYQVYEFVLKQWDRLPFSPPVEAEREEERRRNPKRVQREIGSQLQTRGVGTKAQQALQLQREQQKTERRARSRQEREQEKERRYALRQEKKKARHRGK